MGRGANKLPDRVSKFFAAVTELGGGIGIAVHGSSWRDDCGIIGARVECCIGQAGTHARTHRTHARTHARTARTHAHMHTRTPHTNFWGVRWLDSRHEHMHKCICTSARV